MESIEKPKPKGMSKETWEKAQALRIAGNGWEDIGKQLGLNPTTLKVRWHREGMGKVMKKVKATRSGPSQEILQKVEGSIESISRRVRDLLAADSLETAVRLQGYAIDDLRDESLREQVAASLVKRSATVLGWADASANVQVQVGILASLPDREPIEQGPAMDAE